MGADGDPPPIEIDPEVIGEASSVEDVAQHESGHAVARWALSLPFRRITLHGPGGVPVVEPLPGGFTTSGQDALIATCGCIADWQRRGQRLRDNQITILLQGGPEDRFERDDASTGEAVVSTARGPAVAPGADLYRLAGKATSERWPAGRCIRLWRGSETFAASCRPAIDAVAAALLKRGELSYAEVSKIATAAMADNPAPIIPEWAIDNRAWGYI